MNDGVLSFFFFNDTATTEIYTLSLHDALPICGLERIHCRSGVPGRAVVQRSEGNCSFSFAYFMPGRSIRFNSGHGRSEEHTSELQSQSNLVCRLLLEKKNKILSHLRIPHYSPR